MFKKKNNVFCMESDALLKADREKGLQVFRY